MGTLRSVQVLGSNAIRYPHAQSPSPRAVRNEAKDRSTAIRIAASRTGPISLRKGSILYLPISARPGTLLQGGTKRRLQRIEATFPNEVIVFAEGLEVPLVALYLLCIVGILGVGAFVVSRQVVVKAELDNTAKDLQENVRLGKATPREYFELGAIYLRKKLFVQATKNLQIALSQWDGEEVEKAQIYNALGYSSFGQEKFKEAESFYKQAVELQPGYVTAWTNLGNCYESERKWDSAVEAYEQAAALQPENDAATSRLPEVRRKASLKIE